MKIWNAVLSMTVCVACSISMSIAADEDGLEGNTSSIRLKRTNMIAHYQPSINIASDIDEPYKGEPNKKMKRQQSKTEADESRKSPINVSIVRTRSRASDSQKSVDNGSSAIVIQRCDSTKSQSDSQGLYNAGYDSQTLKETKKRYKDTLAATESDVDTDDDGIDDGVSAPVVDDSVTAPVPAESKKASKRKIRFKGKVSVRGCENIVYVEVVATPKLANSNNTSEHKDDEAAIVIEKKTASYHDHSPEKAKKENEKRKQKKAMLAQIEREWETLKQIEHHPIFTHTFRKELGKISIGFKKFKEAKLLQDTLTDYTEVFQNFSAWKQEHLDPNNIRLNLIERLGEEEEISPDDVFDVSLLEIVMNEEIHFHMQALIDERNRLMTANIFDFPTPHSALAEDSSSNSHLHDAVKISGDASDSADLSSDFDGDTASEAGSTSSVLYFQDMTDMQYFDSLVTRYEQAFTTFKGNLIRLKRKL